jgi:hypothetical protein
VGGSVGQFFGLRRGENPNMATDGANENPATQPAQPPAFDQKQWQSSVAGLIKQLDQQGPAGLGGWLGLKKAADARIQQLNAQSRMNQTMNQPVVKGQMPPPAPAYVTSAQYAKNPQAYPQGSWPTPSQATNSVGTAQSLPNANNTTVSTPAVPTSASSTLDLSPARGNRSVMQDDEDPMLVPSWRR